MTESELYSKPKTVMSGSSRVTVGRLFVLDLSGGRILSLNAADHLRPESYSNWMSTS